MRLEMVLAFETLTGVKGRMTVRGMGEPEAPLTIEATCDRCGGVLSRREYPADTDLDSLDDLTGSAVNDGLMAAAHACGERN